MKSPKDPLEAEKLAWMMLRRADEGGVEILLGPGKIVPDVVTEVLRLCKGKPILTWLELSKNRTEIESPEDIPYNELHKLSTYFGPVLHFKASFRDAARLWRYIDNELLSMRYPDLIDCTDEELAKRLEDFLPSDRSEHLRMRGISLEEATP